MSLQYKSGEVRSVYKIRTMNDLVIQISEWCPETDLFSELCSNKKIYIVIIQFIMVLRIVSYDF